MEHKHDFLDCGYDAQQCDSACRADWHKCSVCGKSRSELAKDVADVRRHVEAVVRNIMNSLGGLSYLLTLKDAVDVVQRCSKELDGLSREQLVEMAVRNK